LRRSKAREGVLVSENTIQIKFRCLFFDQRHCATQRSRKMRRGRSRSGNKRIVASRVSSVVIAIFAEHSTLLKSHTILLTSR
jgi:hypothetical protein